MFENVATNQYYVWRHYLEAWAIKDRVFCRRQIDKKTFSTNPKNIASSRYFYKVVEFTDAEIAYLNRVAQESNPPESRPANIDFVETFTVVTRMRRMISQVSLSDEARAEVEEKLLQAERGIGESWHMQVEGTFVPILAQLRQGDISFWKNGDPTFDICYFIAAQYLRTARMRNSVCNIVRPVGLDLDRVWAVESHLWANQIALAIYRKRQRTHASILVNETSIPFITGDQPIINLLENDVPNPIFYYPITPKFALTLDMAGDDAQLPRKMLSEYEVERLNYSIYKWSDDQIYGIDGNYLELMSILPKDL